MSVEAELRADAAALGQHLQNVISLAIVVKGDMIGFDRRSEMMHWVVEILDMSKRILSVGLQNPDDEPYLKQRSGELLEAAEKLVALWR